MYELEFSSLAMQLGWRGACALGLVVAYAVALVALSAQPKAWRAVPLVKFLLGLNLASFLVACLGSLGLITPALYVLVMFAITFIDVLGLLGWGVFAIIPLALFKRTAYAVMRRNFVGYFSNPTGYVFLFLFVGLTSMAAFWPEEFYHANLANFDQLNFWLPLIMLVFIPAITMSIWAEERMQGTDELLLTLPATDFDVVTGKYLAAAAVFTVSLLYSQICNFSVLMYLSLGSIDLGLLYTTYFGYWMIGLAMLSIGMAASFLTRNLTVGFVLGALFNAPLALLSLSDLLKRWSSWIDRLTDWSILERFEDFGRGVFSLSSLLYFVMLIVIGLYISMVLIGRRHWIGGRDGSSLLGHYFARVVSLLMIVAAGNAFLLVYDWRWDRSSGKVSELSADTVSLLKGLADNKNTIYVDAYISRDVPEEFVPLRADLLGKLREFNALSNNKVVTRVHDGLAPFAPEVNQARQRFGITPRTVTRQRPGGALQEQPLLLGAAFTSGLERVVIPFFEQGVPIEYELIRSINTVAKQERKRLGVVRTDAQIMGGFSMAGGQFRNIPRQEIIRELEKQYEVEEVDASKPIDEEKYDVLMVVQPSSLGPADLDNLIAAIQNGQPTAIFEDPMTAMLQAPGTNDPRPSMGGGMFGGGQPQPKGEIEKLWKALDLRAIGEKRGAQYEADVVWQRFNPYKKARVQQITPEWVFVRDDAPDAKPGQAINAKHDITRGLREVLFIFPGAVEDAQESEDIAFEPLLATGRLTGAIKTSDMRSSADEFELDLKRGGVKDTSYVIAAHIRGKADDKKEGADKEEADQDAAANKDNADKESDQPDASAQAKKPLNVVYVADADCVSSQFLMVRASPDRNLNWQMENVPFVLNALDVLAGDSAYVQIRARKPSRPTLRLLDDFESQMREETEEQLKEARDKFEADEKKLDEENRKLVDRFNSEVTKLQERQAKGEAIDRNELRALQQRTQEQIDVANQALDTEKQRVKRQLQADVDELERKRESKIEREKDRVRFWSVVIFPILPLLVGMVVFVRRMLLERERVSRARLV